MSLNLQELGSQPQETELFYDTERIELRPPYPTEPIDPLSIAPDPGVMGRMYIRLRSKFTDGMTLACATPKRPYEEIKADYESSYRTHGFSDEAFFDDNFELDGAHDDPVDFAARPGQDIDDYTLEAREWFVLPVKEKSGFDVWLPYARSVAGLDRFKHSFAWDGYHMLKGYLADGRYDLALNVLDNQEYQINTFGYVLNGSADFYVTRSQPDYFAHGVRALADRFGPEVLVRYLPAMEKYHMEYWMDGMEALSDLPEQDLPRAHRTLVRMPDGSYLNRYWDDGHGPRLESYKEDVDLGKLAVRGLRGAARERKLQKVYKDLRAGAASGWDFSSRWFKDGKNLRTINTTDILPIDLNSLLAYNEETLAMAYAAAAEKGGSDDYDEVQCLERAAMYRDMREKRVEAINRYMWDPESKFFRDYNFVDAHQTKIISAAMVYPLYVGIANLEQSLGVMDAVDKYLRYPGGVIATATEKSEQQWDGGSRRGTRSKNVWAPCNWAAARGFARMAHLLMTTGVDASAVEPLLRAAEQTKEEYMSGIEAVFDEHRIIPEKHRGDDPTVLAEGGEYRVVKILAMTIETYRAMKKLRPRNAADHLSREQLNLAA